MIPATQDCDINVHPSNGRVQQGAASYRSTDLLITCVVSETHVWRTHDKYTYTLQAVLITAKSDLLPHNKKRPQELQRNRVCYMAVTPNTYKYH